MDVSGESESVSVSVSASWNASFTSLYSLYPCVCRGGAGSTVLIHPLDSLKVKMQTFPHLYASGVQCARDVTRQDGLRGFYRGLTPGITLSMTEASIRYMTYGVCQVKAIYLGPFHGGARQYR